MRPLRPAHALNRPSLPRAATLSPSAAPVFLDGERPPDDYDVRYAGQSIGRIYRMNITAWGLWL
jgi:hypothetical protein